MGTGVCVWCFWWLWRVCVGCGATRRCWCGYPACSALFWLSVAMRCIARKSLLIWRRACWSEGCFFGHWRSGTTFPLVIGGATRRAVRKHRAPKGALRRDAEVLEGAMSLMSESTEHPKISHAIPLVHTSTTSEIRRISTFRLQILNNLLPNCMRHFPITLQHQHPAVH